MSEVFGPRTTDFLKELGHRLRQGSGKATQARRLVERWGGGGGGGGLRKQ